MPQIRSARRSTSTVTPGRSSVHDESTVMAPPRAAPCTPSEVDTRVTPASSTR
jgi:hypothetical protein